MFLIAAVAGLIFVSDANGQGRRKVIRGREGYWAHTITPVVELPPNKPTVNAPKAVENKSQSAFETCEDALDEVNKARMERGLKPYIYDPLLAKGALECAKQRASRLIHGHLPESDFSYLPKEVNVNGVVGGCAAWESGFGACAMYDNYTYCGASWVRGSDGLKYCHIFVK